MRKSFFTAFISIIWCLCSFQPVQALSGNRAEYEKTGKVIWETRTKEKIVAITFDDGPNELYTTKILDILAKYHAKATFFVIGKQAEKFPTIIKREVKEGHEVAVHSYTHNYNKINNEEKLKDELDQSSNVIQSLTGYKPTLFRPVGGFYNDSIVNTAINNDYRVIMWSWHQDTKDWSQPGIINITNQVISNARPGDIILLHDSGGDRSQTVKALENILQYFNKSGYKCITVSEMLYRSKPTIPEVFHLFL